MEPASTLRPACGRTCRSGREWPDPEDDLPDAAFLAMDGGGDGVILHRDGEERWEGHNEQSKRKRTGMGRR